VGDIETAKTMTNGFIQGFIKSLPDGYINSHAHMTLPDAVLLTVHDSQPYNPVQAFLSAIDRPDMGDRSIAAIALERLVSTRNEVNALYGVEPLYQGLVATGSVYFGGLPLYDVMDEVMAIAFDT
jgi:CRISPR system Cascade subunit CasC